MDHYDRELRRQTTPLMQCDECGGNLLIGDSGLVCENGCGRIYHLARLAEIIWRKGKPDIVFAAPSMEAVRAAWPERVIECAVRAVKASG